VSVCQKIAGSSVGLWQGAKRAPFLPRVISKMFSQANGIAREKIQKCLILVMSAMETIGLMPQDLESTIQITVPVTYHAC